MKLTTDVLLFGAEAVPEEINFIQYLKQCRSKYSSPSNFLTRFNKMILLLLDGSLWILRLMTNKYFAVFVFSARCLSSMIKLQ